MKDKCHDGKDHVPGKWIIDYVSGPGNTVTKTRYRLCKFCGKFLERQYPHKDGTYG
jgi:hypothetical protein